MHSYRCCSNFRRFETLASLVSQGELLESPELILILRNERPVPVADVGALLRAFAADYRRVNRGKTLAIAGLEGGSIIARLQEAYTAAVPYAQTAWEVANAAKNLREFVQILRDLFGRAKDDPKKVPLFQRKKSPPGITSVEAMVKTAISGGGELEVYYKGRGEEVSVRVVSAEAIKIREQAIISARELSPPPDLRHSGPDTIKADAPVASRFDVEHLADRFLAAGTDANAVIGAVASALHEAGMGYVLETVAAKLDERGHHSLAEAVRASLHEGNRASEPPERA